MEKIAINVAELIKKIKFLKILKTDKDVATYLNITPNALNNFKRRNSVGAFLEKVIIASQNKENNISFDFLLNSNTNNSFQSDEALVDIKEKIKSIREKANLNTKQFADVLGLSQASISRYEDGSRKPDFNTIKKLIEFGVAPDYLFTESNNHSHSIFNLLNTAKSKAYMNSNEKELETILYNFIYSQTIIEKIKTKMQRSKNLEFLEKLKDFTNGTSEEMLNLFYSILIELEKSQLIITDNDLNEKFSNIVESSINLYIDNQNIEIDSSEFKHWINSELDEISIIELLLSLSYLKEIIKNDLNEIE